MEEIYNKELDALIEEFGLNGDHKTVGNREVSWKEPPTCPGFTLSGLLEKFPEKTDDNGWFGNIAGDICQKLGENYTWFEYEDNVYFYDTTTWDNGEEGWVKVN